MRSGVMAKDGTPGAGSPVADHGRMSEAVGVAVKTRSGEDGPVVTG